jgi:uncharacterized protein with ParB-like and HNH nuclease domain
MSEEAQNLNEIEFAQPLEDDEAEIDVDKDKRKIFTDKGDPEVDSLYRKWTRGKLVLQPDFQRHFVWDAVKASRLVESALLDIPLPVIYLSEQKDGKEYVIDGQQRLTSFFSFISGKFLDDGKDFKLKGLKVFREINGKSFKEIGDHIKQYWTGGQTIPENARLTHRYCNTARPRKE